MKKINNLILDNDILIIEMHDGKKQNAKILFTFNENDEQFILYEIDGIAYGAKVKEDNSLVQIEDDEWNLVEKIFNEWQEEQSKEEN